MSNITFRVESWLDVKDKLVPLLPLHWEEACRDKEHLKLDPDMELFDALARINRLHVVTVYSGEEFVGYHASIIEQMPSYRTVRCSQGYVYFIQKFKRGPRVFLRLLDEVEKSCKAAGVQLLLDRTKGNGALQRMYELRGYRVSDVTMMKWIGDP